MYHRPEIEALIVGAGPVGLYAAIALTERGVPVRIIDEEWRPASRSYALALHPATLTLLDELDLADEVIASGRRIDTVALYEGTERRTTLDLDALRTGFPFLVSLPQSALEAVLETRLKRSGVTVQWNHRLCGLTQRDDQIFARLGRLAPEVESLERRASEWFVEDSVQVHPQFLLGADGHRSSVRDLLGVSFEPAGPEQLFLVFEFDIAGDPGNEVRVVLEDGVASVLWPLPGRRVRWSFGIAPEDAEDVPDAPDREKRRMESRPKGRAFPEPTAQLLADLVARRAPWFDAPPQKFHWSVTVPFRPRLAERFGREHVWLVGDAAHQTGPIGVQSMNAGLRETRDLVRRLEDILLDHESLASLGEWEQGCRRQWSGLLDAGPRVRAGAATPDWVARNLTMLLSCLPATGPELDALAAQLGLERVAPVAG